MWYVLIIINDLLTISGSVMKIAMQSQVNNSVGVVQGCVYGCGGVAWSVLGLVWKLQVSLCSDVCGCYSGSVGVMWVFFNTLIVNVFVTNEYIFLIYEYTLNQV